MAIVYAARDDRLSRTVAIKILADNLADHNEIRARFLRESRIAASLSHPNIVEVYDSGEDGRPFIVMEHVRGSTLAGELQRRGAFPPSEAAAFAAQAAAGLAYAHAAGIVHRDVKPENLLLGSDGTLKITDFGIAHAVEGTRLTTTGALLGTAAYLAPEQATGQGVSPATDVYALGAVLYELLTGRPPFNGTTLTDLIAMKLAQPPPAPSEQQPTVPTALDTLTERCLATDPHDRPSAAEVRDVLRGDLEALTRLLPMTPHHPVLGRRAGRRGRVWVAVTAAAVLVGTASLWIASSLGSDSGTAPPVPAVRVAPVPPGGTPAQRARNLARWLRRYSG